jgi:hypothetical protein
MNMGRLENLDEKSKQELDRILEEYAKDYKEEIKNLLDKYQVDEPDFTSALASMQRSQKVRPGIWRNLLYLFGTIPKEEIIPKLEQLQDSSQKPLKKRLKRLRKEL